MIRTLLPRQKLSDSRGTVDDVPTPELTDRDRAVLDLELQRFRYAGRKEQAIRDRFGISATRYYQLLNALIDTPAALVAEPMLVHRLRRVRDDRQRARHSTRRLAG